MKKKKISELARKSVPLVLGLDGNSPVKTTIVNTLLPGGNWVKFIDTEGDLHASFLITIGRGISSSNATYILNIAKWASQGFCEAGATLMNKSGNVLIGHKLSYKIEASRLRVWMYTDSVRAVTCLSANYYILDISDTPPNDVISII